MKNFGIVALLGSSLAAAQGPWQQCGGQDPASGVAWPSGSLYLPPSGIKAPQSSSKPATSSRATSTLSTSTRPTTTPATSPRATTSRATGAAAQGPWQQCGGQNWTGGTTCQSGWTCVYSNPWYSQCLQPSGSSASQSSSKPASSSSAKPASSSSAKASTTSSSKASTSSTTSSNTGTIGATYKTTVTYYGAGDTFGSGNCNTNTAACFFYTQPGYSAAVSQNLYGAGPGDGQGPACGTCWRITGQTDSSGKALSNAGNSIVVMVNNLCPRDGNPLCSQSDLTSTNQYGANVNFDLCRDSGAASAFFGSSGVGLAIGTATQVDCSQWSGTIVH